MYRTCTFCHRDLGENDGVEAFPIGRRLAFDQARGRLWVVCLRCRRWNLTPIESRWEAIEECERHYRDAGSRFSTDNIGLAQLSDGVELIRIGHPLRPEYAAWRYGRDLWKGRASDSRTAVSPSRRFVSEWIVSAAEAFLFLTGIRHLLVATRVRDENGVPLDVSVSQLQKVELRWREDAVGGWLLVVPYYPSRKYPFYLRQILVEDKRVSLSGPPAIRAACRILPLINMLEPWPSVRAATQRIEDAGDPSRLFKEIATEVAMFVASNRLWRPAPRLSKVDATDRLALEMVAHEESERRALEGELAELEADWREAEEVAAIADRLLIPSKVEEWIEEHRYADN